MWLSYQYAFALTALFVVAWLALHRATTPRWRGVAATAKELSIVMALYGVWRYVHILAITKTEGAMEHGRSLWDLERTLHLPSEVTLQRWFIDNGPIMRFLNVYYGGLHVPAAGIALIWLFVRHRDRYPAVRTTFALSIAGCLTIQALLPMAPPRFFPDLGFVDAGLKYHLSVYGAGGEGASNQLAAMPSLHVAWAFIVCVVALRLSTSRWRWLGPAHLVLTIAAITITANHWWLDGVVAAMVVCLAYALTIGATTLVDRLRHRSSDDTEAHPIEDPLLV